MNIPHSDDGPSSESQSPVVIANDDGKGKQPLVEPPMPQASTPALPIEETRLRNTMSFPHSHHGLSSESQSQVVIPNDDDKSKQPLIEPPLPQASTSAPPSGETRRRKEYKKYFQRIIGHHVDHKTTALQAGVLCQLLKNFGMAPDVTHDQLRNMLKLSRYADENGAMDFERFLVFAEDFKLFESLRIYKAAWILNEFNRGPLGDFFAILEAADDRVFKADDFKEAFRSLDMELTDESADSLMRFADLHPGVNITFNEFLKVLRREHEEYMLRTGQRIVSRRMDALDMGQRVGRLMAFVSAYTRSERVLKNVIGE